MAYKRKTQDEYAIQADYGFGDGFEDVTVETSRKAANEQLKTYRKEEGKGRYRIKKRRIPIESPSA